jgi:LacI family transcriptional regulator
MVDGQKHRGAKPAGLRDVAALAGVSMGTVSNVLNRPNSVRRQNREKVERAMRALNFVGSHAAGQLRSGRSELIGVIVPDVGNPFWGVLLRGIESVADEAENFLIVTSTRQEAERESNALASFLSRRVDGLLVAPVQEENEYIEAFLARDIRVVTFERRLERGDVPAVYGDNVRGGETAAEHLLTLGHETIVFVNGPQFVSWSHGRRLGAERAIRRRGLDPATALREIVVPDLTVHHGEQVVPHIVEMLPDGGAVMCGNDVVALGVLRGMQALSRRVPEDYSLVGYDDVDFAAALSPALTTVQQRPFEMGAAAARLLLDPANQHDIVFSPVLVVRDSTTEAKP